jgi:ribosomal-protein-alanine N-acetyltransferase
MTASADAQQTAVRCFRSEDAAAIASITAQSPEAAVWPAAALSTKDSDGRQAWVATVGGTVEGYVVARAVSNECEILNLAVSRACRRQGLGSRLLAEALEFARRSGSKRCYIEVRASNQPAVEFYRRHGFIEFGRRSAYYRDPPEDGLLMIRVQNGSA